MDGSEAASLHQASLCHTLHTVQSRYPCLPCQRSRDRSPAEVSQSLLSPLCMLHAEECPVFHSSLLPIQDLTSISLLPIHGAPTLLLNAEWCLMIWELLVWGYPRLLEQEQGRPIHRPLELPHGAARPCFKLWARRTMVELYLQEWVKVEFS